MYFKTRGFEEPPLSGSNQAWCTTPQPDQYGKPWLDEDTAV
jgi:hypothetical protein